MGEQITNQLTPAQRKIVDYSVAIFGDPATNKDASYMARELVQCTLPHKNPGDIPLWKRTNGNITLGIQPGIDLATGKSYGYPYGTIPRLLMFWIVTETVRTKSPRLELGNSFASFMKQLGLDASRGGKRSDATRLKDQMDRLFNAFISFQGGISKNGKTGAARVNMAVASKSMLWWSPKEPEQYAFNSWIELSKDFYEAITAAPIPVDLRALKALKKSPLALDLYAWLTYEAYRASKSGENRFETWEQLHSHLGGEYTHIQHFRAKVKSALKKIKLVYPGLKISDKVGGIEVLPESFTALQPRGVTIEGTATVLTAPVPLPQSRQLAPATIERFRKRYPRFDPYACHADFEAWLAGKPHDEQPTDYEAAFMGFAAKWTVNKL